jgi:K+-transporting ATPase ATPase C chain
MRRLLRQTGTGLRLLLALTVILGVLYPLSVWTVSRLPGLSANAEGSVVRLDGHAVGSSRIGVDLVAADPRHDPYFHTRPSASAKDSLGRGNPSVSGGSNLAGNSEKLFGLVAQRKALIAAREGVSPSQVPADAVTGSGSGLDPDISPAYAYLQVRRVARVTGLGVPRVMAVVEQEVHGRELGFLGDPTVSVMGLNLAVRAAGGW